MPLSLKDNKSKAYNTDLSQNVILFTFLLHWESVIH